MVIVVVTRRIKMVVTLVMMMIVSDYIQVGNDVMMIISNYKDLCGDNDKSYNIQDDLKSLKYDIKHFGVIINHLFAA